MILPNTLEPGEYYTIELKVTDTSGNILIISFTFQTNLGAICGQGISVDPSSGRAFVD